MRFYSAHSLVDETERKRLETPKNFVYLLQFLITLKQKAKEKAEKFPNQFDLHFEVLVQGVFQDPQKFLTAGQKMPAGQMTALATSIAALPVVQLPRPKQAARER